MTREITPAIKRAAEQINAMLGPDEPKFVPNHARSVLNAALSVAEMAVALFAHEYPGRFWGDAPEWMQATYTERAAALRAHLLGGAS